MKKNILLGFFAIFPLTANQSSEYSIQLNDKITIGTRRAYECTATIAHLAGFEEFNRADFQLNYQAYDKYFSKYLKDNRVEKAISYFNNLRSFRGFSYDAVADIATYLSSDCHSLRCSEENAKKNVQSRCGDPKKLQQVIADFYDATDFAAFYESQLPVYEQAVQILYANKDIMITGVNELEKYYRTQVNGIFISVSFLTAHNNYGTSFNDGKNTYFEPQYGAGYFDANTFIHELSHPFSNKAVDQIMKNKKLMKLVKNNFNGEKKKVMEDQAYGSPDIYLYELFNRANTNNILKGFCDDVYVAMSVVNDKRRRFDEIQEVTDLMNRYRLGSYKDIYAFLPELEKEYIKILENLDTEPQHSSYQKMTLRALHSLERPTKQNTAVYRI